MREFNDNKRKRILITFLLLTLFLTVLTFVLAFKFGKATFVIGGAELHINTLIGCTQIIIYIMELAMIFAYPRLGLFLSIGAICISMFGSIGYMVRTHQLDTLTGPVNSVFFLIAAYVVSRQCIAGERRAVTDDITGLFNSYEFEHTLYKKVQSNEKCYLLIMHIDGFSQEYANLGREAGDEILHIISNRIRALIDNKSLAFKLEGAEFSVILPSYENYAGMADRLIRSIEEPVQIRNDEVSANCYLTAHIGIAVFLDGKSSSRDVIKQADIAKNFAMKSKRSKICVYTESMNGQVARAAMIEKKVKESLDKGYFYLVYQPQYSAKDKELRGFETLIGMNPPSGERYSAGEFIDIAEKSELIFDIDRYVLRRAMREFAKICNNSVKKIIISINVSAKEFSRAGFASMLLEMAEELKFPLDCLEIEITEYSLAAAQSHTIENINKIREHGVLVALDDFGTGYTSLGQLMTLPINTVKIDKTLIDNVATSERNADFVKSAVYMGHLMNAEVIAEGVETEEQLEMLRQLDCEYIQGLLWGKSTDYANVMDVIRG